MNDDGQHKISNISSKWWWTKHIILNPQQRRLLDIGLPSTSNTFFIMSISRSNTKQRWKRGLAVVLVIIII